MADPISIAMAAAVAGGTLKAAGAYQQGRAQAAANDYNADINERNAQVAEQQIQQLQLREDEKIVKFREDYKKFSDAQSQAFRHNGWIASSGTPLKVALASAAEAEEEISTRKYNAKLGVQSLNESALEQRMSGNLQRMYASSAKRAGITSAGTSLLGGAGNAAQIQMKAGSGE